MLSLEEPHPLRRGPPRDIVKSGGLDVVVVVSTQTMNNHCMQQRGGLEQAPALLMFRGRL